MSLALPPSTSVAAAQAPSVDIGAIERMATIEADSGFSGVIVVAAGDSILLEHSYGPHLTTSSPFWIGSMTKGVTAAAILALEEEGRLTLADSLRRFFPDAPADKRGITIRELLTHTSGIAGAYAGAGIARRADAVRAILAQPLEFAPGTGYRYQDDDFELLAAVVEVASGERWETYLERRLLHPARLDQTGFWCRPSSGAPGPVAAAGRTGRGCGAGAGTPPGDWGHRGANGMFSTGRDLLRWMRALRPDSATAAGGAPDPGRHVESPLTSASRTALATPQVFVRRDGARDVHSGLGVRIYVADGRVVEVMHSGSSDDNHTGIVRIFPSGLTIVVLSNAGQHAGTTWSSYVAHRAIPGA